MAIQEMIFDHGYRYRAAPDRVVPRYALLAGQVSDEMFPDASLQDMVSVQVSDVGIDARVTCDTRQPGLFCLSGEPELVFPRRAQQAYTFQLTLEVPGYLPAQAGPFVVDANTVFPLPLINVRLQAQPVSLVGRVTDLNGNALGGVWVQVVDGINPANGPVGHAAPLRTPLQVDFPAGTPVFTCDLADSGTALALVEAAQQGATVLQLDRRTGLSQGQLIRLGLPEWGAYYRVAALSGPVDLGLPGSVTLNAPLHRWLADKTAVQAVNVTNPVALGQLAQPSSAGDWVILLDNALGSQANQPNLQVGDGPTAELHLPGAVTGTDGYYRLEGIRRARTLVIEAHQGSLSLPNPLEWSVDYASPVNVVNLRLI